MKNITLSIDEHLLTLGREYAKKHDISFNVLVRKLIEQNVTLSSSQWLDGAFKLMDDAKASSEGKKWTREELHRG
ncbi:MAG: hypothetical protein LBT79_03310 [Elusimicrobiota bacterium]|jgi:hypothetical protein|nr:hypothetical protein [Elusimicrobiota bacterium]